MTHIGNREEFDRKIAQVGNTCVLFTADWCPDCQVLKPVLPWLVEKYKDSCDFLLVNRDDFMDLCRELDVFGIPSFITYKKSEETGRFVSTRAKSREEIEAFLDKSLSF